MQFFFYVLYGPFALFRWRHLSGVERGRVLSAMLAWLVFLLLLALFMVADLVSNWAEHILVSATFGRQ